MSVTRKWLFLIGVPLLVACENDAARSSSAPPPAPPPGNGPVLITLSDSAPARGGVVSVHADLRPGSGVTVASYAARLTWDRAGLVYLRDLTQANGLHALNPQSGVLRIAGASSTGFTGGRLFSLEFRVTDPAALTSLELRLGELNGADFRTALPRVALDRVARFAPAAR